MHSSERFNYLLNQYLADIMSPEEKDEFFMLLQEGTGDQILEKSILDHLAFSPVDEVNNMPEVDSREILQRILNAKSAYNARSHKKTFSGKRLALQLSAAAILLFVMSWSYLTFIYSENKTDLFSAQIDQRYQHNVNNTDSIQILTLSDDSRISLYPGASFHFPEKFADSIRVVYLEGKAFFEVAPDSTQPFIVHSRHITAHVLGTSFWVNTDSRSATGEVEVRSGKVRVSPNTHSPDNADNNITPVLLTPNQKAVYETKKRLLTSTLASDPQPIAQSDEKLQKTAVTINFSYEQELLSKVFNDLEKAYGIEISLESVFLGDCSFTGNLTDNNLFTQLKIICLATQSSYEVDGTKIRIKGSGCH